VSLTVCQAVNGVVCVDGNDDDTFTQGARIRSQLFYKAKVKSLRMTALIVLAFIVCWTPYQVIFSPVFPLAYNSVALSSSSSSSSFVIITGFAKGHFVAPAVRPPLSLVV